MKTFKLWGVGATISLVCLLTASLVSEAGTLTAGKMHIGTFEGSTTFTTSSSNGINPGLFIEVRDADGNLKQYESEDGVITVENTKEGAYVTQAKLLGKTKYVDQTTDEVLDEWESGRDLELVSVENPVLTTIGKNMVGKLVYGSVSTGGNIVDNMNQKRVRTDYLNIENEEKITIKTHSEEVNQSISFFYDENKKFISQTSWNPSVTNSNGLTILIPSNAKYVICEFSHNLPSDKDLDLSSIKVQMEKGNVATSYEPYQSNVLTVNKNVELPGMETVQDELDLIVGEVTQRITDRILYGGDDEDWRLFNNTIIEKTKTSDFYLINNEQKIHSDIKSNKFEAQNKKSAYQLDKEGISCKGGSGVNIWLSLSNTKATAVAELRNYLQTNPVTVQYQLAQEGIESVEVNSTYQFNLVSDSVVKISGEVVPTIYSITVPSQPLTFVLNPNEEAGQQFIAPEFQITNQSAGPIQLELKAFQQVTNLFNDVLPEEHEDWSQLNKKESKDIALALVPNPSDAWLTLNEGPKYVANATNLFLGEIRRNATAEFSFSALHGGVFDRSLFPEYRLVFTFGF